MYFVEDQKKTRISNSGGSPKDPFPGRTVGGYRIEELVGAGYAPPRVVK